MSSEQLALDVEALLRNHRGVSVRMPNWNRQPQKCHFFEILQGTEIDPANTQDRNLAGITVPEGHVAMLSKIQMSVEYWAAPARARASVPNWRIRRGGAFGQSIVNGPGVLPPAAGVGAVDIGVLGLTGDTSFRTQTTEYLYIYLGYPVYRTAENRMAGDINWQPAHHRNGIWIDFPVVLWGGDSLVFRTENDALATEPRVSLVGIRGWVAPFGGAVTHGREGMITE